MSRFHKIPNDTHRMVSIKVDGISARATVDDMEYLFEKYGKIGDIYIPKERHSKDNRGFAFIRYFDRRDAEDAMDALDGKDFEGKELRIQMAKYDRNSVRKIGGGGGRSRSRSRSRDRRRSRSRSRSRGRRRSYSRSNSRDRRRHSRSSERRRSRSRSRSRSGSRSRSRSRD